MPATSYEETIVFSAQDSWKSTFKRMNLDPPPPHMLTEINSRNTNGSNVRAKTTNYIEKNVAITCMTSDWSLR